jgi:choline kinase
LGFSGVFFEKEDTLLERINKKLVKYVEELVQNPNNSIFVLSDYKADVLQQHLGHINGLVMISDGGFKIKKNGFDKHFIEAS